MKSGAVKGIIVVGDADFSRINVQAFLEGLMPQMQISYKRDVASDCRILTIQDDPRNWNSERLGVEALKKWEDLRSAPIHEGYSVGKTVFGAAWVFLMREEASKAASTPFRYPKDLFPWTILFDLFIRKEDAFSGQQAAALEEMLKSSELTYTDFREPRLRHKGNELTFGPYTVQFYDPDELHDLFTKISSWTNENDVSFVNSTPVKCKACDHYTESEHSPCIVCQHKGP